MKTSASQVDEKLISAAQSGNAAEGMHALREGANVNCETTIAPYEKVTPLMLASQNCHNAVARILLNAGADVRKATSCIIPDEPAKETALHWAARARSVGGCKLLVQAGANVNAKSTRGTPLTYAIEADSAAIVKLLLKSGAEVSSPSGKDQRSALEWAGESGFPDIVKTLLKHRAKPKPNPLSKKTPLMLACVSNHAKVAALLIRAKDSLEAKDKHGWTPLMYAAWGNSGECVQLLLKGGANPRAKNKKGRTAFELAHEVDSHEAVYYLERA